MKDTIIYNGSEQKIRQEYTDEDAAFKYYRYLESKGLNPGIRTVYDVFRQITTYTVDIFEEIDLGGENSVM